MKNKLSLLLIIILIATIAACDKEENNNSVYPFSLVTEYDSIRSCPGSIGLFIIKLDNSNKQNEKVNLRLKCDEDLNTALSNDYISIDQSVLEVIIRPSRDISISDFKIMLIGERKGQLDSMKLNVNIIDWNYGPIGDGVSQKKRNLSVG
jgi:hypothetical protein